MNDVLLNFFRTAWSNAQNMPGVLIFYAAAQLADVWSTMRFMRRGIDEANPLLDASMDLGGYWWVVVKLLLALIAVSIGLYANSWHVILLIAVVTGAVAIWNETA